MLKITRMAISQKRIKKKKKKKKNIGKKYFYTSVQIFNSKLQIPIATNSYDFF